MKWTKKGLIYVPDGTRPWARHSALTPTPMLLNEETIRVYAGFRDEIGVSRIGYVDLAAEDPSQVKGVSEKPVLDTGVPGAFDDNGVILGDIIEYNRSWYMYYVGFQLVEKAKFLAFTGLAISTDCGNTFSRYSRAPILDRSDRELYIRAIHSVLIEDGVWKAWCGIGNDWVWLEDGRPYPQYNIRYLESRDGITFKTDAQVCIDCAGDEYRIGRPRVTKEGGTYKMFYTKGTLGRAYLPGYAESTDGLKWTRMDDQVGIEVSKDGWDSTMLCYPSILTVKDTTYMFYNGNDYGKTGFGYAVLEAK